MAKTAPMTEKEEQLLRTALWRLRNRIHHAERKPYVRLNRLAQVAGLPHNRVQELLPELDWCEWGYAPNLKMARLRLRFDPDGQHWVEFTHMTPDEIAHTLEAARWRGIPEDLRELVHAMEHPEPRPC